MTASATQSAVEVSGRPISQEDTARAQMYGLLAHLLSVPPDASMLAELCEIGADNSEIGQALNVMSEAARATSVSEVEEEFHDLFIGVGRGELLPYASYYLTGFLNEKPLARLRTRMAEFGIERDPSIREPEDHIAALMDMMAGLITGAFGQPATLERQKVFFAAHVGDWAPYFFRDLEKAMGARFYAPVGGLGTAFLSIEQAGFEMVE